MKKLLTVTLLVLLGTNLFAFRGHRGVEVSTDEILSSFPGMADKKIDELTFADYLKMNELLSIKKQEQRYIKSATTHSAIIPGIGQFQTGDITGGALFLATDIAIIGGSLFAMQLLKPDGEMSDHKFFNDGVFDNEAFIDSLPVIGIFTGGLTLAVLNRVISSKNARNTATEAVESGTVIFTPHISVNKNSFQLGINMSR